MFHTPAHKQTNPNEKPGQRVNLSATRTHVVGGDPLCRGPLWEVELLVSSLPEVTKQVRVNAHNSIGAAIYAERTHRGSIAIGWTLLN